MAADTATAPLPVLRGVLQGQRRSLVLWGVALAAVCTMYTSFYPSMGGGEEMQALLDSMPDGLVQALGYDAIGTPGGYLQSTVFGLLGPVLLLVFAVGTGARLFAGQEEDGTLELELTAPVSRRQVVAERLLALWTDLTILTVVLAVTTWLLTVVLDMDVAIGPLGAGVLGLWLLVLGFGTTAMAVGAATGRRGVALGVTAGAAVVAFMLNAIGPGAGQPWMSAVSPFGWYLGPDPLIDGFAVGMLRLAVVPAVMAAVAWWAVERRDLMV